MKVLKMGFAPAIICIIDDVRSPSINVYQLMQVVFPWQEIIPPNLLGESPCLALYMAVEAGPSIAFLSRTHVV